MTDDNFQKLKRLISENKILLLPHKKYKGIRQMIVYARCGISKKYFEKAYNNGSVILQMGELGPRIGYPILWEKVLEGELNEKKEESNQNKNEIIRNFEITIKKHEDQLFGIRLFYEGIKELKMYDEDTLDEIGFDYHYNNIMERGQKAISEAKELLKKVKSGKEDIKALQKFEFPPIHGPGLDEMTQRASLLVKAYEKLFPNRSREIPLTPEEHEKLREEAIKNFENYG